MRPSRKLGLPPGYFYPLAGDGAEAQLFPMWGFLPGRRGCILVLCLVGGATNASMRRRRGSPAPVTLSLYLAVRIIVAKNRYGTQTNQPDDSSCKTKERRRAAT